MTVEYVLECPACRTRFQLRKYVPEKRVRCRKCRTIMSIPYAPGQIPPNGVSKAELPSESREKLRHAAPIRRIAILSLVLLIAIAGAIYLLKYRIDRRSEQTSAPTPEPAMTLAKLQEENRRSAFPLALGYAWKYTSGEERRVIASDSAPNDEPQFTIAVTHPRGSFRERIRMTNEGALLLEEDRLEGGKSILSPPILLLPRNLNGQSAWNYTGVAERGGVAESVNLEFRVTGLETLTVSIGTYQCYRVDVTGHRGAKAVAETRWFAIGVGLLQRLTHGVAEEAKLSHFSRPGG